MEFISKRKLLDTDKQLIDEIKNDMLSEGMNYIYSNYRGLLNYYWFKFKFIITPNFNEIKLAITAYREDVKPF